jgi:hypothetical protein
MTKPLEQLVKEYGNACYANDNDDLVIELEREIMNRIKPIGYLPAYVVRTISNDGAWDSFTLSRERSDPTDIEVFL